MSNAEPETGAAPGFEPTSPQHEIEVSHSAQDPALVTDASEMASAFPTKFGVEGAEPIHVGVASEFPDLYQAEPVHEAHAEHIEASTEVATPAAPEWPAAAESSAPAASEWAAAEPAAESAAFEPIASAPPAEAPSVNDEEFERRVAAAMQSSWTAEEAPVEPHEQDLMIEEEPQPAVHSEAHALPHLEHEPTAFAAETVPAHEETQKLDAVPELHTAHVEHQPAPEPVAEAVAAPSENAPDQELAAAMAAAVGSQMEPEIVHAAEEVSVGEKTMPLDQHTALVAEIVHRVTERMKPDLVAEIARELAAEMKKRQQ
jgi:hypothetical protein